MKVTLVALNAHYMHTNLALRQIIPRLGGYETRFFEGHINQPFRDLLERVADGAPDVICFSCYIWNIALTLRLCRALRLALPKARLVLGGPEIAYRQDPVPEADYVIAGEGETALPALLRVLDEGREPDADNADAEPLHPADWTDPYAQGIEGLENRILYAETSRGCPFRCQFCLSSLSRGVRALPAGEAARRLIALADRGASLIKLVDRTFNFDPARANQIWEALIAHARRTGYRGTYHFEIGGQLIDEAALSVLSRAPKGLFQFEIGVQSSDVSVLSHVSRSAFFPQIAQAARALVRLGTIHLHLDLIAGLPGDTLDSFARSFDDVFRLGADHLQLGFLKLLHGSPLRQNAEKCGLVYEPDPPYEILRTRGMRFDELRRLKDVERALEWYANSGLYPCALRWLLTARSPFSLFDKLARSLRAAGTFDAEQGERARAQALLETFDDPALRMLITHDFLRAGRRRDLPETLRFEEDAQQRALLRERFRPVRGQSALRHPADVLRFERDGALDWSPGTFLYAPGLCEKV